MSGNIIGNIIGIGFWVCTFIAFAVLRRRMLHAVAVRVDQRGGRPISDPEAWARLAWVMVKGLLWPVTLVVWLLLGRPQPGRWTAPERDAEDTAAPVSSPEPFPRRTEDPSSGLVAPPPGFPGGPAGGTSREPKAPAPTSMAKGGGTAYVSSSRTPAAPPSLPSPVLDLPRAERGAPQLEADYALRLLRRAGFPATPHNVFAVQERLGVMFSIKAKQFIEGTGTARQWETFVRRAGYPERDMHAWPQQVLNALARWGEDVAPYLQDFEARYGSILLEGHGTGDGSFFGGRPDQPLPTASAWHLQGIAQPTARLMPAP